MLVAGPRAVAPPDSSPGVSVDSPPPLPPQATARPSLSQLSGQQEEESLGNLPPQTRVLKGLKMIERGSQLIGGDLPGMAPALMNLVGMLRQAVPEQLAAVTSPQPGMLPPGGAGMPPSGPPSGPPGPPQSGPPQGSPAGI
jgi:hypothetical protein